MTLFEDGPRSAAAAIFCLLTLVALLRPRRAEWAAAGALALAALVALGYALSGPGSGGWLRIDVVTCVVLGLVCGLGWAIVRYSVTYLQGEPRLASYLRWLLLTLAAVVVLASANHLLLIALAWTATSLTLHQLLTFYSERPAALIAAHKKFLVSRLADGFLWSSLLLVQHEVGSLSLERIAAWATAHPELGFSMQLAAVLLVLAVALKSAQLPFHGWLTQVMEAPTPVSALLHAGVINLGAVVMLRLAPWLAHATVARWLLIAIGLSTAVLAALVMTTRVSVKVALAWSTCAQMGFLLVQCGLGAWPLALLHLAAHSLYKAHAFLEAGSAVEHWRLRQPLGPAGAASGRKLAWAGLGALAFAVLAALAWAINHGPALDPALDPALAGSLLLLGLSLAPLAARRPTGRAAALALAALAGATSALYLASHWLASALAPSAAPALAGGLAWALVAVALLALFAVQATLASHPGGALARTLYPWLYAGLYLDERFTRLTFRLWPPRLRPMQTAALAATPPIAEVRS